MLRPKLQPLNAKLEVSDTDTVHGLPKKKHLNMAKSIQKVNERKTKKETTRLPSVKSLCPLSEANTNAGQHHCCPKQSSRGTCNLTSALARPGPQVYPSPFNHSLSVIPRLNFSRVVSPRLALTLVLSLPLPRFCSRHLSHPRS